MKTYRVTSPLKHDRKRHEIGASVELDDKHAQPLLAAGVIEPSPAAEPPADEPPADEQATGKTKQR